MRETDSAELKIEGWGDGEVRGHVSYQGSEIKPVSLGWGPPAVLPQTDYSLA